MVYKATVQKNIFFERHNCYQNFRQTIFAALYRIYYVNDNIQPLPKVMVHTESGDRVALFQSK